MKIIKGAFSDISVALGRQEYKQFTKYKRIAYSCLLETGDGYLFYNLITRELILLTKEEYIVLSVGNLDSSKTRILVEKWFLVPKSMDDVSMFYVMERVLLKRFPRPRFSGKFNLFTIFPTTKCNARCPYCYEMGASKKHMTDAVAKDTAKFIVENRIQGKKIHIRWFGGEPLFNQEPINIISDHLNGLGIEFDSSMVTNGYLLNKVGQEQVESWWLKSIQVTIDGTRENYNKTKNYIYQKDESPYDTVMKNIEHITELGVSVVIRLNVSHENISDMYDLVDALKVAFDWNSKVSVYSHTMFEGEEKPLTILTSEGRLDLCQKRIELEQYIQESGLSRKRAIADTFVTCHCMADNGRSIVILPDGNLTLCEHHIDDEILGNIYDKNYDSKTLSNWNERQECECASCFYYPQCYMIKKCPADLKCDESYVLQKRHQVECEMQETYRRYLARSRSRNANR